MLQTRTNAHAWPQIEKISQWTWLQCGIACLLYRGRLRRWALGLDAAAALAVICLKCCLLQQLLGPTLPYGFEGSSAQCPRRNSKELQRPRAHERSRNSRCAAQLDVVEGAGRGVVAVAGGAGRQSGVGLTNNLNFDYRPLGEFSPGIPYCLVLQPEVRPQ